MSATNELIQTVYEFRSLLKYLGERYPEILNEWKNIGTWAPTKKAPHQEDDSSLAGLI